MLNFRCENYNAIVIRLRDSRLFHESPCVFHSEKEVAQYFEVDIDPITFEIPTFCNVAKNCLLTLGMGRRKCISEKPRFCDLDQEESYMSPFKNLKNCGNKVKYHELRFSTLISLLLLALRLHFKIVCKLVISWVPYMLLTQSWSRYLQHYAMNLFENYGTYVDIIHTCSYLLVTNSWRAFSRVS